MLTYVMINMIILKPLKRSASQDPYWETSVSFSVAPIGRLVLVSQRFPWETSVMR